MVLLADALSAAAGRTVVPPRAQALHSDAVSTNWTIDPGARDGSMRDVVIQLQRRHRVRTGPVGRRARLAHRLAGRRRTVECQG